eukprot:SAG31_NODE_1119_length_9813_cov_49.321289_7_plen_157_part_00
MSHRNLKFAFAGRSVLTAPGARRRLDERLARPDLVVGLNAGLGAYQSFVPTISLLVNGSADTSDPNANLSASTTRKQRPPCFFTDYSAESCRLGQAVLAGVGQLSENELAPVTQCPFLCPRTEKSGEAGYDLPSYGNAYCYGSLGSASRCRTEGHT